MAVISMKALLESGVHFGHRTYKWHPKMRPYIFTERNSIHIIDLQKTVKLLEEAYAQVRSVVAAGGSVLFVGTKRQAQETIQQEAMRAGMPYVTARWLGGMLTNWRTIRERVNELERLEKMRDRGDFARITKKEAMLLTRKIERLEMLLGGIRHMTRLPQLLFVVDVRREETAIHEANLLGIPVIGMVDTNCDPSNVDFVIPSNDDAIRAIKLIVGKMGEAALEGRAVRKDEESEETFDHHAIRAIKLIVGKMGEAALEGRAVRKDEESQETFTPASPMTRKQFVAEEPEISDDDLLGAATLKKLSASKVAAVPEWDDAEIDVEDEA